MNPNISPGFRARFETYVRPLPAVQPSDPEPSWTQTLVILIIFGTLAGAVVANEALNFMGWLR